jgi:hypothetical protein
MFYPAGRQIVSRIFAHLNLDDFYENIEIFNFYGIENDISFKP